MPEPKPVFWGIHVRGHEGDALYLQKCYIGIGWGDVGDLGSLAPTREAFKQRIATGYPKEKPRWGVNAASQLYRFVYEMKPGEFVVYRSKIDREIHIGEVEGEYEHRPDLTTHFVNVRKVRWLGAYPLTKFSQGALYELGSALTLFQVTNYMEEYRAALLGEAPIVEVPDDATVGEVAKDIEQNARDFLYKQLAQHLKGYGFQAFVAHLLVTMGYRTQISGPGTDGGVDITAHKDELMLEPPIIKVQVKSAEGSIGSPAVQQLAGNLMPGECGLFITLGTFSKQALQHAKGKPNLRLIDGDVLMDLVLKHYEDLDAKYKALIPLKRVYIPQVETVQSEESD